MAYFHNLDAPFFFKKKEDISLIEILNCVFLYYVVGSQSC